LINDLEALPELFIIALDDYHLLHEESVQQIMIKLVDAQPPGLHLVIASRSDPRMHLPSLRAGNQITEIRTQDLRFSEFETEQFLQAASGKNLDHDLTSALCQRTEGWIAGLCMAAISLEGSQNPTAFLEDFSRDPNDFVMEYLISELLIRQSESTQQYLLQTWPGLLSPSSHRLTFCCGFWSPVLDSSYRRSCR